MLKRTERPLVSLCFLLPLIASAASLAVMSIDLGNEFMKIGIVKPGVPMEIVLNVESGRKTSTVVAMRPGGDREFSNPAVNTAGRFPSSAYIFLRELLAKNTSNPIVKDYQKRFPYYKMEDDSERGTINFEHPDGTKYSVEELLAMIMESARNYASVFAEQKVSDAVIICPAHFNQAERRSLKRAAEMAGIKVLQLMNTHAAVALNYGVFRRKEFNSTAQNYMFFDVGSTSTTAAIVSYQVVKMKVGTMVETNPQLTVRGVGFDRSLGSLEITLRMRDHLAKLFNEQKKAKNNVLDVPRAMAKLSKEAERVKKILSANSETYAQIENVMEDVDFKAKVTREELETMCADIFERIAVPVQEALKNSEMSMSEISEVILMGGGTRIPKIQEMLQKTIGRQELGKSINTDEAAALGAVYQAAYLSTGFRVMTFAVKDANIYPIQVDFERTKLDDEGVETTKTVRRTLFNRLNPYPQKKLMTFNKHTDDFDFYVNYGDLSFLPQRDLDMFGSMNLTEVALEGVKEQLDKHLNNITESKGVKAHFRLDESGILNLDSVEIVFERLATEKADESTFSKLSNTISSFFGSSSDEEGKPEQADTTADGTTPEAESAENAGQDEKAEPKPSDEKPAAEEDDKSAEGSADKEAKTGEEEKKKTEESADTNKTTEDKEASSVNGTATNDTKPAEPKPVTIKRAVTSKIKVMDGDEPDSEHIKASKELLLELSKKDEEKAKLAAVQNELESFSYDVKNKLYEEEYEECSTEEEREEIRTKLTEIMDWYEEQTPQTTYKEYDDKLSEAKKLVKLLFKRVSEFKERPRAMEALKSSLNHTKYMLKSMRNYSMSAPEGEGPFTEVELQTLEDLQTETKEWMKTMKEQQKKKASSDAPAFTIEEVAAKIGALDREVKYLLNKAKMWKPKKPKVTIIDSNTTKTINETSTSDGAAGDGAAADDAAADSQQTEGDSAADSDAENTLESPDVDKTSSDDNIEQETQEAAPPAADADSADAAAQETLQLGDGKAEDEHEEL